MGVADKDFERAGRLSAKTDIRRISPDTETTHTFLLVHALRLSSEDGSSRLPGIANSAACRTAGLRYPGGTIRFFGHANCKLGFSAMHADRPERTGAGQPEKSSIIRTI